MSTFEIIDDPVSQDLARGDPVVEVSELGLGLQEGPEDLHLEQERAQLSDCLPRLLHRPLLLLTFIICPQLKQKLDILSFILLFCLLLGMDSWTLKASRPVKTDL